VTTSMNESRSARAVDVRVTKAALVVDLEDGRTVTVPIGWYPRLFHGTPRERSRWSLIAGGEGIHWPELDEDISVDGILAGRPSKESQSSLHRWLTTRQRQRQNKRVKRSNAGRPRRATKRSPSKAATRPAASRRSGSRR